MSDDEKKQTKCECSNQFVYGVEYRRDHFYHYDGISEWRCAQCHRRWGRWTGKELKEGEWEPKYGIIK